MLAAKVESMPATEEKHHVTFFRQSGWLMIATVGGGVFMWAVHFLANNIGPAQYTIFGTLLSVLMSLPVAPLQMVFAQQTAAALATGRNRQLTAIIRFGWIATLV